MGLLEIGEDIIFFVDEGGVEGAGPEGDIDKGVFSFFRIIVEVIDPGAFHRPHVGDEVINGRRIITIPEQGVLQTGFPDVVFIDVGEGIGDELEGNAVEGPVGEFDGKRFFFIGLAIDLFDAVESRLVPAIVIGDVEGGAGGGLDQDGQEEEII